MAKKNARGIRIADPNDCPVMEAERQLFNLILLNDAFELGTKEEQRRLNSLEALEIYILNSTALSMRGAVLQVALATNELAVGIETEGVERQQIARALIGLKSALRILIKKMPPSEGNENMVFRSLLSLEADKITGHTHGYYAPTDSTVEA